MEYFTGEVKCADCKKLLCKSGLALCPYYQYNGPPEREREDTESIMWMNCYNCHIMNKALSELEAINNHPKIVQELISKRHWKRRKRVYADNPGYNYFGAEYKKLRREQVESVKRRSWIQIVNDWDSDRENEDWFNASMEIPNAKDERYITEIITIRYMIDLGFDYRERMYRADRYKYRDYSIGEIAKFHSDARQGKRCINCAVDFAGQQEVDEKINGLICVSCIEKENKNILLTSINQHLGRVTNEEEN